MKNKIKIALVLLLSGWGGSVYGSFAINADSPIVVPKERSLIEAHACGELELYLSKVFLKSVPIRNSLTDGGIVLGTPNSSEIIASIEEKLNLPDNRQGFVIANVKSEGKSFIAVASKGGEGVLYGVYELLEQMGVRFICQGDDVIPHRNEFALNKTVRQSPAFSKRGFGGALRNHEDLGELKRVLDWMAKHRLNALRLHRTPGPLLYCETDKKSDETVKANQKLFRDAIDYANIRGIKLMFPFGRLLPHVSKSEPYVKEFFEKFPEIEDVEISGLRSGKFYYLSGKTSREEDYDTAKIAEGAKVYQDYVDKVRPGTTSWIYFWGAALPDAIYTSAVKYGFISTWNFFGKWNPSVDIPALEKQLPEGIGFLQRDAYTDYGFADPVNPWITKVKDIPVMAVFASSAEYGGRKSMFYTKFNLWIPEFKLFAKHKVPFVCVRRRYDSPIGQQQMYQRYGLKMFLLNDIAYAKLAWDPETCEEEIWRYWASGVFPGAVDEIMDVLDNSEEIIVNSLYLNKQFISRGVNLRELEGGWNNRWRRQKWLGLGFLRSFEEPHYMGETIPVDVLREAMARMMADKDLAVQMATERLDKLQKYKDKFTAKQYSALKRMLTEDKTIVEIYHCHTKAFYLYQLIKSNESSDNQPLRAELQATARKMRNLSNQLRAKEVDVSYGGGGRDHPVHQFNKSVMQMDIAGLSRYYEKFANPDTEYKRFHFSPADNPDIAVNMADPQSQWLAEQPLKNDNLWSIAENKKGKYILTEAGENCPGLKITCSVPNGRYMVFLGFGHSLNISFDGNIWHTVEYRRNKHALQKVNIENGKFIMYIDDQATTSNASLHEIILEKAEPVENIITKKE